MSGNVYVSLHSYLLYAPLILSTSPFNFLCRCNVRQVTCPCLT
jgi:hypothetical protein